MNSSNIKVYLAVSGALIVLLILIIVIPFANKKTTNNNQQTTTSTPLPTSVETNPSVQPTKYVSSGFTGVAEEELPQQVLDLASQKKDLRQKTPLDLSTFSIDFDYNQDKFVVTLKDPKDSSQKEFESWRVANYSALGAEQFLLK